MNSAMKIEVLGDVLGSLHYMGQCPACGSQHMSRNERVATFKSDPGCYCLPCGRKREREAKALESSIADEEARALDAFDYGP